jgi:hypothetical protein
MSTIFHVMKEEFDRLNEAHSAYSRAIANMPKGSPCIKHIRNGDYLYLEHRDGKKVVFDYIGVVKSVNAEKIIEQVNKRKRFEKLLKEVEQTLKDVKMVLRGKI